MPFRKKFSLAELSAIFGPSRFSSCFPFQVSSPFARGGPRRAACKEERKSEQAIYYYSEALFQRKECNKEIIETGKAGVEEEGWGERSRSRGRKRSLCASSSLSPSAPPSPPSSLAAFPLALNTNRSIEERKTNRPLYNQQQQQQQKKKKKKKRKTRKSRPLFILFPVAAKTLPLPLPLSPAPKINKRL